MILKIILLSAILYSQEFVGSWQSYTSFHHIKSCQYHNDNQLFCLTEGGILTFNFTDNSIELISVNEGLTKSYYNHFQLDSHNLIWVPNNKDNAIIITVQTVE